ncbi:cilia- and flagella-associated protein 52-like [Tubulanus polymorphus]|uniref:cilia- and flagella-associated protein 52-like n=1 Tax=Tubulanus polymorphus TaxID=672921 RepID=UPI003DA47110
MPETTEGFKKLTLCRTIGFNGKVAGGLIVHPSRQHLIYPLGCTVIIEEIGSHKQDCLFGHTNDVTCVAVSKHGRYIASGQTTHMGFTADIIVWDFATRQMYCKFTLHKVKVEALAFSPNEMFLLSLGGKDDGCVVVWNLDRKQPICGQEAQVKSAGTTNCVAFANQSDYLFVTGGRETLRVWELDVENRKITPSDVNMGKIKREVECIQITENDDFIYCGTSTGDILGVNPRTKLLQASGPVKDKFSRGVTSMTLLKNGDLIVGSGAGDVCCMSMKDQKYTRAKKSLVVDGLVTSVALRGDGHQFFVGTKKSNIYKFTYAEFSMNLPTITAHYSAVNDITFPFGTSKLFGTCSEHEVRVWETETGKLAARIVVPNMTCNGLEFSQDGRAIVTAWNDGKIRAFFPESGKPMYTINDAHSLGVTALALTSNGLRIISGGGEGQVRVWDMKQGMAMKGATWISNMKEAMKEHTAAVTFIRLRKNDKECVTASCDGTCIIWNLETFRRNQIIFENTLFKCICYNYDECQVITGGTDRKIGYWECHDGSKIRELDGSKSGAINGMDLSADGTRFVTGGDDNLLKVWKYNEGTVTHCGVGHSGNINRVKISPNDEYIISVSQDGAILVWKFPE